MTNARAITNWYATRPRRAWSIAAATVIISLAAMSGLWLSFDSGGGAVQAQTACETGGAAPDGGGLARDCSTLLGLKSQLAGTATLNWSADLAMASWDGIRVGGFPKRVTRLHLHAKELTGTVPAALSQLDELQHLNLERNQLTGSIPGELGMLSELTNLALGQNKLTGAIPAEIAKMPKLGSLYLRQNQLSGGLPEGLGTSDALWLVSVERNGLTGPLPASLSGLSVLWVSGNKWSCAPAALLKVGNNDLAGLSLPECAESTATPTPSATATATPTAPSTPGQSGPLGLIVVSDGSHDSLLLEWTGGPANATKWQYRQRRWENMQPLAWEAWTDIPSSGASTHSYRLAGLSPDTPYDFEVRAVVGAVAGEPSVNGLSSPLGDHPAGGMTHKKGALPGVYPLQIVEGDGRTQWRIHYLSITMTIPDGARLVGGFAFAMTCLQDGPCADGGTDLTDLATGSVLAFSDEGVELGRQVVDPTPGSSGLSEAQGGQGTDVDDLFDQLIKSVKVVPQ